MPVFTISVPVAVPVNKTLLVQRAVWQYVILPYTISQNYLESDRERSPLLLPTKHST